MVARQTPAIIAFLLVCVLVIFANLRLHGHDSLAQSQALCPPGVMTEPHAGATMEAIALELQMSQPVISELELIPEEILRRVYRVDPMWVSACYWYAELSGTVVLRRRPPHALPTIAAVPTRLFDRLIIVLEATSGGRVYTEYRNSTYPTPIPGTTGPSPTPVAEETPRPFPTLPEW